MNSPIELRAIHATSRINQTFQDAAKTESFAPGDAAILYPHKIQEVKGKISCLTVRKLNHNRLEGVQIDPATFDFRYPLELAVPLIKAEEAFVAESYQCSAGVWTVGWGATFFENGSPVGKNMNISVERAEFLLCLQVIKFARGVDMLTQYNYRGDNAALAALYSFAFNIGLGAFEDSTMLRLILGRSPKEKVELQFHRWIKGGAGLADRRRREARLFMSSEAQNQ
jgi:lysozyme